MSLKLTDVLFDLKYLAAEVGSSVDSGLGQIFANREIEYTGPVEIPEARPVVSGGKAKVLYRLLGTSIDMKDAEVGEDGKFTFEDGNGTYCVMYLEEKDAKIVKVTSQFIPSTLHAILTVALYSGDACNAGNSTKAGEIVIDIPRFQLDGAFELAMTATGAAQTSLNGNALAAGCSSCDGKSYYATISQFIEGSHWYDDAAGLIIEDLSGIAVGDTVNKDVVVYAYYNDAAPRKLVIGNDKDVTIAFEAGTTGLTYTAGKITGTAAAGTAIVTATCSDKPELDVNKAIVIE